MRTDLFAVRSFALFAPNSANKRNHANSANKRNYANSATNELCEQAKLCKQSEWFILSEHCVQRTVQTVHIVRTVRTVHFLKIVEQGEHCSVEPVQIIYNVQLLYNPLNTVCDSQKSELIVPAWMDKAYRPNKTDEAEFARK